MNFKLKLILRFDLDKQFEMRLEEPALPGLVLKFSRVSEQKDKRYGGFLCTALTEAAAPTKIAEVLQSASAPFPKAVQSFADDLQGRLCDAAERAVKLLRWFRGSSDGHNPIGAVGGLAYSADGNHWQPLPTTVNAKLTVGIEQLIMSDEVADGVADLWQKGAEEPLAHELFREAAEQEHKNPRSSLVLGVAAAEVGFKQLVGNLVPDAKWLADNVPSPPLVVMLTEYFPTLPTEVRLAGTKPKVPGKLIEMLKKAVLLRNQVAHGKSPKISADTLHDILATVHDCLYLFDYYNGQCWAWDRITSDTRKFIHAESSADLPHGNQHSHR
ncbi:MAG: hypothetical protein ACREXX_21520 [Gammaproteobacteria bacterium]